MAWLGRVMAWQQSDGLAWQQNDGLFIDKGLQAQSKTIWNQPERMASCCLCFLVLHLISFWGIACLLNKLERMASCCFP